MKKRLLKGLLTTAMAFSCITLLNTGMKAEAKWIKDNNYECDFYPCGEHCFCYGRMSYQQKQEVIKVAEDILSKAPATPHEKVKYFHDTICKMTTYHVDKSYEVATPYGVLINNSAKCVGYANTFRLLCDLSGIPCHEIIGTAQGNGHEWNIVQLEDGEWYEVDCTYDDTASGEISYQWFLLTTEEMNRDHERNDFEYTFDQGGSKIIAKGTTYAYNKNPEIKNNIKNNIVYKVEGGKAVLADATEYKGSTFTVPNKVSIGDKTYKVTSISDNAFKGNQNVKNVTIGKNIKTVGAGAFSECPNLKNVDMSKCKVTSLSKNLFKGSKKISKLTLNGDNVVSVGKNALKNIAPKCKITIKASQKNNSLVKKLKKQGAKKCSFKYKQS